MCTWKCQQDPFLIICVRHCIYMQHFWKEVEESLFSNKDPGKANQEMLIRHHIVFVSL